MAASLPLTIRSAGAVTSVGLTLDATCAAIRAKLTLPTTTRFMDPAGNWIAGHQVPLGVAVRGVRRLAALAIRAVNDCLERVAGAPSTSRWPLLLCIPASDEHGRPTDLARRLVAEIVALGHPAIDGEPEIIAEGRVGIGVALHRARHRLQAERAPAGVLIAAVDSLLTGPALGALAAGHRLLSPTNSDGFMPGEAATCVLVTGPRPQAQCLVTGLGFAVEPAHIDSDLPLRGNGLQQAFAAALADAGRAMGDLDWRIADLSGEQYYFREAELAFMRTLRTRKETFDLWHPAECIGEVGAAIGPLLLAVARQAWLKAYAPGRRALCHLGSDSGRRVAIVLEAV
ncbi:MAG: hypothetical protein AB7G13_24800 [Lautropia sp.]